MINLHINPDLDLATEELEYLQPGQIVEYGDLLGYTHKMVNEENKHAPLNFGIINNNAPAAEQGVNGFGYWQKQELCHIGFDGQTNLLR